MVDWRALLQHVKGPLLAGAMIFGRSPTTRTHAIPFKGPEKMKFRHKRLKNLWIRYLRCRWRIQFREQYLIRIKERMVFQALGHIRKQETIPDGYIMEYREQYWPTNYWTLKMYDRLFGWYIDMRIMTEDFYYEPDERHDSKQPG